MTFQTLSIIVPVYNEEKTIKQVLKNVLAVDLLPGIRKELVVVDDCSTDASAELIEAVIASHKDNNIKLFRHEKNKGKGAAFHTGISKVSGDITIIQDADLEYCPSEYNVLLAPVIANKADVVYGSRFVGGSPRRVLYFWHAIGNKFLTNLSNYFTDLNLTDMETGFKLFRSELVKEMKLKERRFGIEPELTQKLANVKDVRFYEVGISYNGRTYSEGKKIGWKDGFRAIYCILKYGLKK